MKREFFPNRDRECFGTALANYFVWTDENPLAQRVYNNFRDSEINRFVEPNGEVPLYVTTKLVRDLTDNKYVGNLHLGFSHRYLNRYIRESNSEIKDRVLEVFIDEVKKGHIMKFPKKATRYPLPALVFCMTSYETNHCMVSIKQGYYIDDGVIKRDKHLLLPIMGILEIECS